MNNSASPNCSFSTTVIGGATVGPQWGRAWARVCLHWVKSLSVSPLKFSVWLPTAVHQKKKKKKMKPRPLSSHVSAVIGRLRVCCSVICRRWPTRFCGTPHTPRSSTSGTCSCSARAASAAGCCGHARSTGWRSCPCRGWSCCRYVPASRPSPSRRRARRSPATSRSTPGRWCGRAGAGGAGSGAPPEFHQCSGYEAWWAWPHWSAPSGESPPLGNRASPASTSSTGSYRTYRGIYTSASCGPTPSAKKIKQSERFYRRVTIHKESIQNRFTWLIPLNQLVYLKIDRYSL